MEPFRLSSVNIKRAVFMLIVLSMLSLTALLFSDDDPSQPNRIQTSLLAINFFSFLALLPIVSFSIRKLLNDYKVSILGAKL
jgi:hypothetical protein